MTANHRVNDAVFSEDGTQLVMGRFMYGPLDMVTLTGEKVKPYSLTPTCLVEQTSVLQLRDTCMQLNI